MREPQSSRIIPQDTAGDEIIRTTTTDNSNRVVIQNSNSINHNNDDVRMNGKSNNNNNNMMNGHHKSNNAHVNGSSNKSNNNHTNGYKHYDDDDDDDDDSSDDDDSHYDDDDDDDDGNDQDFFNTNQKRRQQSWQYHHSRYVLPSPSTATANAEKFKQAKSPLKDVDLLENGHRNNVAIDNEEDEEADIERDYEEEKEEKVSTEPYTEVTLSRSAYRLGETIVGTIRLVCPTTKRKQLQTKHQKTKSPEKKKTAAATNTPREIFQDALVYIAGWCRIDPRWHKVEEYTKIYGTHPMLQSFDQSLGGGTVCFWSTNVLDLMTLQERSCGHWKDAQPKPIRRHQEDEEKGIQSKSENNTQAENGYKNRIGHHDEAIGCIDNTHNLSSPSSSSSDLEKHQASFTLRVDLPSDIPHSYNGITCRYFYSVVVGTRIRSARQNNNNKNTDDIIWYRIPFRVLSPRPDVALLSLQEQQQQQKPARVRIGLCTAMAHSTGLPCYVSAKELVQPMGRICINSRGNSSFGSHASFRPMDDYYSQQSPPPTSQTMRIADTLTGDPCCYLTIMGSSVLCPGSRLYLKFDFPSPTIQQQQQEQRWCPCYQVACCLEGEEFALYEDGSRKRTKAYRFDTDHSFVEPETTERTILSLLLPLDSPCTLRTDLVEIQIRCIIDITVGSMPTATTLPATTVDNNNGTAAIYQPKYRNLRLSLPCCVVHRPTDYEMEKLENNRCHGNNNNNNYDHDDRESWASNNEEPLHISENNHDYDNESGYTIPIDELLLGPGGAAQRKRWKLQQQDHDPTTHPSNFQTNDIQDDLKILALRMAEKIPNI